MAISKAEPPAYRLLVRPLPLKGEGLRGYLLRVGERNGYENRVTLCSALTGCKGMRYRVSEEVIDNIALALAMPREQIEAICYRQIDTRGPSQCLFFGHQISVHFLRGTQSAAVCPHCLAEQQAVSGLWDLRAVCACPHHGNWLIDQCPGCGELLKWNRSSVARCYCGFDLRHAQTKSAPADVLVLTTLLHERVFEDLPTHGERAYGYPAEIRQTPLRELLALFRFTAEVLLLGLDVPQAALSQGSDMFKQQSQVAILMTSLLQAWPNELLVMLCGYITTAVEHRDVSVVLPRSVFKNRFRGLLTPVRPSTSFHTEVPAFFRQALARFWEEHCITDAGEGHYLNPAQVTRAAGGERILKRDVCHQALRLPQGDAHEDEFVSFQAFLELKKRVPNELFTPKQAKDRLACNIALLKILIEFKLLQPWIGNDLLIRDVEGVVSRFEEMALGKGAADIEWGDRLPLTSFKRKSHKAIARLVDALMTKQLGLYKAEDQPIQCLSDLYLSLTELRRTGHLTEAKGHVKQP